MNRSLLLAGTDPFRIIFVFVLYVPLWLVNAFVLYGVAWAATWPLVGLARSRHRRTMDYLDPRNDEKFLWRRERHALEYALAKFWRFVCIVGGFLFSIFELHFVADLMGIPREGAWYIF